jgi:hypothetical protein
MTATAQNKVAGGIDLSKADEKNATLTLRLRADSGYCCDATYRISPNEWAAILAVAEKSA